MMGNDHDNGWVRNLLTADAYAHGTGEFELLETHISWVVLTGEFAYKIKKPVGFPFVDFSTLELREKACREELRLNRRWSAELYLSVEPVTGSFDRPRVGGRGEPFEFAVRMRQFSQDCLLTACVERGELQAAHLERFALDLARFHQRVACDPQAPFGTPEAVRDPVMDNFEQMGEEGLDKHDLQLKQRIRDYTLDWLGRHTDALVQRRAEGYVRECHGDLHLRNMLLLHGRIELFDCLEFDPWLRWGDVMSEVAFLVMDLENRGRRDLARRFLNAYIEHTGDHAGLAVLPFYITYRAMVRAKVDQLQRGQGGREGWRRTLLRELERYLEEAASYARASQPRLAVMSGLSGSGKTYHSVRFVEAGFIRLRSDFERKRLAGSPLDVPAQGPRSAHRTPSGESLYTAEFTRRTYDTLVERAEHCLGAGYSVLIDATCLKRRQRRLFIELAERLGVRLRLFVLENATAELERRIRARAGDARDLSDADVSVLHMQLKSREPLTAEERTLATVIDERRESPQTIIEAWLG